MAAAIYIISKDQDWADNIAQLCRDEELGAVRFFPLGKGALSAYKSEVPDVVLFDLREQPRDITVAMAMLREIYPRMAHGGVCVLGNADPGDRAAIRKEREQLERVQLAEYLPRNIPDSMLLDRFHSLELRAKEHRDTNPAPAPVKEKAPAAPTLAPEPSRAETHAIVPEVQPAPAPSEPVPCMVKLLLKNASLASELLPFLRNVGGEVIHQAELLEMDIAELPDNLVVDAEMAEQESEFLSRLRQQRPGMRIVQLPDDGGPGMKRLSRDVSSLLGSSKTDNQPQAIAHGLQAWVQSAQEEEEGSPVVLLVEDEQNIRELTAHYLLLQGYEVYQAEDGLEAMTVFRARRPNMILSDVYMPRMNGFKLLLEVKNWSPDMPMLMMTGYSSAAQVLSTTKYRNVSFLPKPFRLSELGEKIRGMLGGRV